MQQNTYSRQMWHIAVPAIITNISVPLLGLVDTFIMGHLPDPRYLGAIALGAMMISILFNSVNFLRMATTGLTAQAHGREDKTGIPRLYLRAALLALGIGALFILIQWPLAQAIFSISKASSDIEALAAQYFTIRIWGAPFALLNFAAVGWLLGLHKAKEALWVQLLLNVSNICFNILFVYGMGMDVEGVALGTVLAEFIAGLFALYLISRHCRRSYSISLWGAGAREDLFDKVAFMKLFALNRDIFLRTACLTGSMAAFTLLGAGMGKQILAANALLMNIQMITSYGLDGFAQAAEVLVGKEVGRKSRSGLRTVVIVSSKWALVTAAVFSLVYFLFGNQIINALTNLPDVRATAEIYLIWVIVLPLISIWCFQFDGIFIGATAGKYMRNGMVTSTLLYALSLYFLLPVWGNHGLWFSYSFFLLMRGVTLALHYPKIEAAAGHPAAAS
tara:strand:- start:13837 stop:15180 length:1344 start_codon:yes stop_codon:yes gene_type:complete